MSLVKTKELTKKFGSKVAVSNCTIELEKGKIYGLLGPNGSGKSTLMKMIAGLFRPTKGEIEIAGSPISYKSKATVAYMTTEDFMYENLTIKQIGQYFSDFFEDFDKDRYKELIKLMVLEMDMKVGSLSSGMASKLKIAATMSRKASVIMLDEPLNGIDLIARDQIIKAIIEAASEENAIVISSHLVDQMEPILDEVLFIKEGEMIIAGVAEDIRQERQKSIVDLYREVFAC